MTSLKMMLQISALVDSLSVIKFAEKAQQNGYYGVSIPENMGSSENALVTVGALSQKCEKLHLMTNVVNYHARHPLVLGMAAATLSHLTSGKFVIGLGSGAYETLKLMNIEDPHPLRKMKESIEIVRKLVTGEEVNFKGEYYSVLSAKLIHERRYPVPIYVAAIQEKAIRFVSKIADGILLSNCSTLKYVEHNSKIIKANTKGKDFQMASLLSYLPVKDRSEGLKTAKMIVQRYFMIPGVGDALLEKSGYDPAIASEVRKGDSQRVSEEILDSMVVIGGKDKMLDRLEDFSRAGVTLPIVTTPLKYLDQAVTLPSDLNLVE